jgi:hypothetical protein
LKDVNNIFRNVEKMLGQARWFDHDWRVYNRGPYLQLYKSNWCNENNSGVHFETFIESPQIRKKTFPVLMHAEEDCILQAEFIHRFLLQERDRIKKWKGYSIEGRGYSVLQKILPLNYKNLESRIFGELCQLRLLAESIDKTLARLSQEVK